MESKYYPPALFIIFSLFMGPKLSMLIGLLIGYVEAFDYLNRVELGANTAAIWESKSFFKSA